MSAHSKANLQAAADRMRQANQARIGSYIENQFRGVLASELRDAADALPE